MEVYCLDKPYLDKYAIDINDYLQKGFIGVDYRHRHASEIALESSIPGKFVIGYQMISLPSFRGGWTKEIFNRFIITINNNCKMQTPK